jgi:hypothetical protein
MTYCKSSVYQHVIRSDLICICRRETIVSLQLAIFSFLVSLNIIIFMPDFHKVHKNYAQ